MTLLYEACVTSVSQARLATRAGAGRLELCARIGRGGLTPPMELVRAVCSGTSLPVHVMIRHDHGDFRCDRRTLDRMLREVGAARQAGARGIVAGILAGDGDIARAAMRELMAAAGELPVTFHRAFDTLPDPVQALDTLADLGVARVLTSGGAATATAGTPVLRHLVEAAGSRLAIIAAGTVRADHVAALISATGVREVHAHLSRATDMKAMARALEGMRMTPPGRQPRS